VRPHCLAGPDVAGGCLSLSMKKDPAAQDGAQITEGGRWRDRQPLANDVICYDRIAQFGQRIVNMARGRTRQMVDPKGAEP
jgi:hypothetical protein